MPHTEIISPGPPTFGELPKYSGQYKGPNDNNGQQLMSHSVCQVLC